MNKYSEIQCQFFIWLQLYGLFPIIWWWSLKIFKSSRICFIFINSIYFINFSFFSNSDILYYYFSGRRQCVGFTRVPSMGRIGFRAAQSGLSSSGRYDTRAGCFRSDELFSSALCCPWNGPHCSWTKRAFT